MQVVHRDIAVRNFLVDFDGRVMLCDFGLTRFLPDGKKEIGASSALLGLLNAFVNCALIRRCLLVL